MSSDEILMEYDLCDRGTVTKMKYESAVPLQRAPYFEQYTDHVQGTLL